MFDSLWDDVKRGYASGNTVIRLIYINVAVFLVVNVVGLLLIPFVGVGAGNNVAMDGLLEWLMVPSQPLKLLTRPWTIVTYMFLHEGLFHILFNMLILYWFGRILQDLLGDHRIMPIYVYGGLAGFLLFFLTANIFPEFYANTYGTRMLGASAGVMAVVMAAATTAPTYQMSLILIGPVQIRWIALFMFVTDLIALRLGSNTGGHFAHIGGALMGYFFVKGLRAGNDLGIPLHDFVNSIANFFKGLFSKQKRKPKVVFRNTETPKARPSRSSAKKDTAKQPNIPHQEKVDTILDKIKKSGYESLSDEEKEYLFNASKK